MHVTSLAMAACAVVGCREDPADRKPAARRGPPVETFLVPALRTARWTVTPAGLDDHEPRKLEAIACYASQTRAFGGMPGIARATRAFHRWWGGAEPVWRAH